jgi:hypothetical protein
MRKGEGQQVARVRGAKAGRNHDLYHARQDKQEAALHVLFCQEKGRAGC